MFKLFGTAGAKEYSFELKPGNYSIGRDEKSDFRIENSIISRRHAVVKVAEIGNTVEIEDLGSSNGTYVNGRKIDSSTLLKEGDNIRFGSLDFYLSANGGRPGMESSAITDDKSQKSVVISLDEMLRMTGKAVNNASSLIKTISEMAKMLIVDETENALLDKSLRLISQLIPGDRLAILFVDERKENFSIAASYRHGKKDPGTLKLSRTIINDVIENKSGVLITDPGVDSRFAEAQSIIMSEMKSAMAVPLIDEQRVLGILYADTVQPIVKYNDEHLRIMAIFANIIASRLANLALLQEKEQKRIIELELERASEIQKNLLVSSMPEYGGFTLHAFQEQSLSVGGDLYDAKVLPNGKLLFVLADVSGKGMGAALVMSNILASLRTFYEHDQFEVEKVVRSVSVQLVKFTDPGIFATMFIGLADSTTGKVEYVNAGHNAPYLARADGAIELLEPTGIMIGAFDFVEWTKGEISMNSGDQILIFSDGLPDAQKDNNLFGEARLKECTTEFHNKAPEQFIESIMYKINSFVGNAPQFDDMTVMALKKD